VCNFTTWVLRSERGKPEAKKMERRESRLECCHVWAQPTMAGFEARSGHKPRNTDNLHKLQVVTKWGFFPEPPEEEQSCQHLDVGPVKSNTDV
jgi:hypothetical protein